MSFEITVEITLTVKDDTQAEKIFDAVSSGLAETAIKDRVLYGGAQDSNFIATQQTVSRPSKPASTSSKSEEASKLLRPVEVKVPKGQITVTASARKPERSRGILGRKQINRTGRN